ncbi:unnamed protein product [Gadus morhua 'NCC']
METPGPSSPPARPSAAGRLNGRGGGPPEHHDAAGTATVPPEGRGVPKVPLIRSLPFLLFTVLSVIHGDGDSWTFLAARPPVGCGPVVLRGSRHIPLLTPRLNGRGGGPRNTAARPGPPQYLQRGGVFLKSH